MKEKFFSPDEEYKKCQEWAEKVARSFDFPVEIDEGAHHFIIPIYDEGGKITQRIFLPARVKVPLEKEPEGAEIQKAIRASRQYPDLNLKEAIKKWDSHE